MTEEEKSVSSGNADTSELPRCSTDIYYKALHRFQNHRIPYREAGKLCCGSPAQALHWIVSDYFGLDVILR